MLDAVATGKIAPEDLLPLVYEELRHLAGVRMAQEKPGHTLQPTALVHEAWLQLAADGCGLAAVGLPFWTFLALAAPPRQWTAKSFGAFGERIAHVYL